MNHRHVKSKTELPTPRRRRKSLFSNVKLQEFGVPEHKENFVLLPRTLEEDEKERIRQKLQFHFIFSSLNDEQMNSIFDNLQYCMSLKDSFIFKQSDDGNYFFIIQKGTVNIIVDGRQVKTMEAFDCFGDFALLYNSPRSASAFCEQDTFMWTIERTVFRSLISSLKAKEFKEHADFLKNVSIFNKLKNEQLEQLGKEMILERYRPGDFIVKQGEDALAFFLIKSGRVNIKRAEKLLAIFQEGAYFGENAFSQKVAKRNASVIAETHVECYSISRSSLIEILGGDISAVVLKNQIRDLFAKNQYLRHLTNEQLEHLMPNLSTMTFETSSSLFAKGTDYKKLVIVLEGFLLNSKLKDIAVVGAVELYEGQASYSFQDDVMISPSSRVCEISFDTFESLFGKLSTLLERNQKMRGFLSKTSADRNYDIHFDSVNIIEVLGQGGYGTVYLVEHSKTLLAMKAVHKQNVNSVIEMQLLNHEKEIMKLIDFPFIVQLEFTFKINNFIFFFTEYVEGMKFDEALLEMDLLSNSQAQFYAVQLILILEYLHGHSIIYRDLKPENLLIQPSGYLKLLDLGASKNFNIGTNPSNQSRTFTVAGTPHYMAPEIITGGGYGYSVDFWSLGVILYELLIGYVPFGNDSEDIYEIYGSILRSQIEFPEWFTDTVSIDLIKKLLNKNCEARSVFATGYLKIHPWFEGVDWLGFLEQKVKPDFKPEATPRSKSGQEVLLSHLDSMLENKFRKDGLKNFNKLSLEIDMLWDSLN